MIILLLFLMAKEKAHKPETSDGDLSKYLEQTALDIKCGSEMFICGEIFPVETK